MTVASVKPKPPTVSTVDRSALASELRDVGDLVLIVDDHAEVRRMVSSLLAKGGYEVEAFDSGEACLSSLGRLLPDAIFLDIDMPGLSGLETLERLRTKNPNVPVIMLTADDAFDNVVSAMRLGAYDYILKPVRRQKLVNAAKNAIERYRMTLRITSLEREVGGDGYPNFVGRATAVKEVFNQMDRLAATDISLLVHGESGTGKELVAQAIHANSARRRGPFVALNCAAVPETLQESELFGHEKGAFTGAMESRKGKFELADRGTLFLDEVGELSLALQAKLLRTLQEGTLQRVGGSRELSSDFRLIAATHRDLAEEVREGRFREDLYFRVVVFELELPPLRERDGDIELLVEHFVTMHAQTHGSIVKVTPEVLDIFRTYAWPGNVRELQNVIQRAIVFADAGSIRVEHLPARILSDDRKQQPLIRVKYQRNGPRTPEEDGEGDELNLDTLERLAIEKAMARSGGNVTEVGRLLGISRATLYRKLKKYTLK